MITLGTLQEIDDINTVWREGSDDFSEWLAQDANIDILAQAIGLQMSAEESHSPGCVAASESGTGRRIIITGDFSRTGESRLGRLITLAAMYRSDILIWIVRHASPEHKAAAEWLNSRTDGNTGIFLCELRLFRIGDSVPGVKFEVISRPDMSARNPREISVEAADIDTLRFDYWNAFQDYAFDGGSNPKFAASYRRWQTSSNYGVVFGTGRPGVSIIIAKNRDDIEAGLNISDDRELFSHLSERRDDIESESGMIFDWLELPGGKGYRIRARKSPASLTDKSSWPDQFEWIMSSVLNIRATFGKHIKESENGQ